MSTPLFLSSQDTQSASASATVLDDYMYAIDNAKVYEIAKKTPLDVQHNLSQRLHNLVLLKREDTQPVFSFKLRGAYNRMVHLSKDELTRGVVTASAGNHAQGVAFSAQKLHCRAVIVMPVTTPQIKVNAVNARGAEVILFGDSYSDSEAYAKQLAEQQGLTFVHPYDDPLVIAGQGTIAKEILEAHPGDIEAIFCCVGGGGLAAGVAAYIKAKRPEIKIIGVEAEQANAMTLSRLAKSRVMLGQVNLFADGAAVKQVGVHTFELCQKYLDAMLVVSNDAICAAIKDVFEDTRCILEPAGALAVAGLKEYVAQQGLTGKTLVAVASGANMNFDRLRFVAERAELGEHREAVLAVTIPERPGAFKAFCRLLGHFHITEFNYRYADAEVAHVFVGVAIQDVKALQALLAELRAHNLPTLDLTNNEMAKLHLRHLVGGRATSVTHERLFRFEFPERQGALMRFLDAMSRNWNISLFHYRNHGADFGRVLAGIQVPPQDTPEFQNFLMTMEALHYPCQEETNNPAYPLFLGPTS